MKKILLVALAAAAMVGCSQNEEIENAAQKAEIQIGTVVKAGTKAVIVDNSNFNAFTLSAYIVDNEDIASTGLGTAYMNGIKYTGTKGSWATTDGKFYWPLDKKMQFFAYPSTVTDFTAPSTGYPTFTFTVGGTVLEQTDLVAAHSIDATKTASVMLTFKHLLTRINFSYKPENSDYTYTITSITIKGVAGGAAKYAFNGINGAWDLTDATSSVDYTYPIEVGTLSGEYYPLESENGSLMLLPQSVVGKTIEIEYETSKDSYTYFKGTKTVTLAAGSTWGIGQSIRYKLILPVGAEEIAIDTDVENLNDTDKPETAN